MARAQQYILHQEQRCSLLYLLSKKLWLRSYMEAEEKSALWTLHQIP